MSEKVLVLIEHRSGKVKGISWEAIGFGQKLASQLNAEMAVVLLGHEIDALATEISQRCGQPVLVASDPSLANYTPEAYCAALSRILEQQSPLLLLMGHTYQAIDFAPKLATMLGRGFIPNCVDYQWDGTQLDLRAPGVQWQTEPKSGIQRQPASLGFASAGSIQRL